MKKKKNKKFLYSDKDHPQKNKHVQNKQLMISSRAWKVFEFLIKSDMCFLNLKFTFLKLYLCFYIATIFFVVQPGSDI